MNRRQVVFEGFSLGLPAGWSEVVEEGSYSDPDRLPPVTITREDGVGAFYVQPLLYPGESPSDEPHVVEGMAIEWGERRGHVQPLACASERREDGCLAGATYRIGDEFVQVWFLCDGTAVLHASYVCPWSARDDERGARDALVASLTFS